MTKATAKPKNYTDEMVDELVEAYTDIGELPEDQAERDEVIATFAEKFGKSIPSIRQKLVGEGVYIRKEYRTKTGKVVARKDDLAMQASGLLGVDTTGLEKAPKQTLERMVSAIRVNDQRMDALLHEIEESKNGSAIDETGDDESETFDHIHEDAIDPDAD